MAPLPHHSGNSAHVTRFVLYCILGSVILFFGKALFVPMFYGLFIAMVMYPACKWMESKRIPRSITIGLAIGLVVLLFATLMFLLYWQIGMFREDMPQLIEKLKPLVARFQGWLNTSFSFTQIMQAQWLHNTLLNSSGNIGALLQATVVGLTGTFFSLFLVPIFAALFLYNRRTFVNVLYSFFGPAARYQIDAILKEVVHTYFHYIKGLVFVYIIVGILNSIGLMMLGIKHAILFGMLTAIMTIIPYVGIVVSAAIPVTIAFIFTNSIWYPIGVILVFSFVQYLEANIIFPKVVGIQLNVSTWATLVAILAGGIIWGVSGMILFIPLVAILKIVASHVQGLRPLYILLSGNEIPVDEKEAPEEKEEASC